MEYSIEKKGSGNGDHFVDIVDDLLDFPNEGEEEEEALELAYGGDDVAGGDFSADTSTISTAVDSCNSSFSGSEPRRCLAEASLSGDLCEPVN